MNTNGDTYMAEADQPVGRKQRGMTPESRCRNYHPDGRVPAEQRQVYRIIVYSEGQPEPKQKDREKLIRRTVQECPEVKTTLLQRVKTFATPPGLDRERDNVDLHFFRSYARKRNCSWYLLQYLYDTGYDMVRLYKKICRELGLVPEKDSLNSETQGNENADGSDPFGSLNPSDPYGLSDPFDPFNTDDFNLF